MLILILNNISKFKIKFIQKLTDSKISRYLKKKGSQFTNTHYTKMTKDPHTNADHTQHKIKFYGTCSLPSVTNVADGK